MSVVTDFLRSGGQQALGLGDAALTIGKNAAMQPVAGLRGIVEILRGKGMDAAADAVERQQAVAGGPQTARGGQYLQDFGNVIKPITEPLKAGVDAVGAMDPASGAVLAGLGGVIDPVKGAGRAAKVASKAAGVAEAAALRAEGLASRQAIGLKPGELKAAGVEDPAMVRSMRSNYGKAGEVPAEAVAESVANRARLNAEPATTPGAQASEAEWAAWGDKHGVDMTRSPDVPFSDVKTKAEFALPGGLEGKFTIPDLFHIKANNFDPNTMSHELHNDLMLKFLRTHKVDAPDAVDKFNRLQFAQLSPNAPLTQNEFMSQRYRLQTPEQLRALAERVGEPDLGAAMNRESGVGAAHTGGMGVRGTANAEHLAELSRQLRAKPEMFDIAPGETMQDLTKRVMNQTPGLSTKTGSLATPWLDLERANVSAVDIHGVRNNWRQLLDDPEVGDAFTDRMRGQMAKRGWVGKEATREEILAAAEKNPTAVEKLAIGVVGGSQDVNYRLKSGKINPAVEASVMPDKLEHEPAKYQQFNPFYEKVMERMQPAADSPLELFPEQWRKWDRYRDRIEPHEFAHPDFRKLPKQSFAEMNAALQAHKDAGYMKAPKKVKEAGKFDRIMKNDVPIKSDWRNLYYGKIDPELLATMGAGAGGLALAGALRGEDR